VTRRCPNVDPTHVCSRGMSPARELTGHEAQLVIARPDEQVETQTAETPVAALPDEVLSLVKPILLAR
jgi:hypothetical protein